MRFGGVWSGAQYQERILEASLVQNVDLLMYVDRTCRQEEMLPWGSQEWSIIYL